MLCSHVLTLCWMQKGYCLHVSMRAEIRLVVKQALDLGQVVARVQKNDKDKSSCGNVTPEICKVSLSMLCVPHRTRELPLSCHGTDGHMQPKKKS